MSAFSSTDLFAVGSGLDIAGGYLLARGLIASPGAIMRRSLANGRFFSPSEIASQLSDKVDATVGLISLGCGFATQAVAYALLAGGFASSSTGWVASVVALGTAVLAAAAVLS